MAYFILYLVTLCLGHLATVQSHIALRAPHRQFSIKVMIKCVEMNTLIFRSSGATGHTRTDGSINDDVSPAAARYSCGATGGRDGELQRY